MVETYYLVHMRKCSNKKQRFFITIKNKKGAEFDNSYFNGIGYWTHEKDSKYNNQEIREVYIPLRQIDFVESLIYKHKQQ